MPFKRRLIFVLLAGSLLLSACNLAVVTPTPLATATATVTQTPLPPTSTPTPFGGIMPTPTLFLIIPPTPTLTLFYNPTATATPSWSDCPLIVTRTETNKGVMLHIRRCEDNLEYDLGPLAKGIYAMGPNGKFIVYVTDNGMVYAAAIGSKVLSLIINLRRAGWMSRTDRGMGHNQNTNHYAACLACHTLRFLEHNPNPHPGLYVAVNKNLQPYFVISFDNNGSAYRLVLIEKRYGQKYSFTLPVNITSAP